jgi:hypothetical protein
MHHKSYTFAKQSMIICVILNANPGFGTPITEEGVIDFLTNSKLNLHLSTIDEKGDPNIHQTWSFHASTNAIYVGTGGQS